MKHCVELRLARFRVAALPQPLRLAALVPCFKASRPHRLVGGHACWLYRGGTLLQKLLHPLEGFGMAPKHGRLEEAEQPHQLSACPSIAPMPAVLDGHVHLDEWKHACGQPGGVQWGTRLHHQRAQLPEKAGNLLITLGIIRTDPHGEHDEQSAKLQRVLQTDLSVDGERADEPQ
eukprot:scaffold15705_cov83-Phaeocystis_antarctica.AAC.2